MPVSLKHLSTCPSRAPSMPYIVGGYPNVLSMRHPLAWIYIIHLLRSPQQPKMLPLTGLAMLSPTSLVLSTILAYILFVRLTRWRVYQRVHRKYGRRLQDLNALTPAEAQDIIHASMLWDLPSVIFNSLSFAIVRTYAIVRHFKL